MATKKAVKVAATRPTRRPSMGPVVELFGHVTLVESYTVPGFTGCHALVALRDSPGVTVAVLTTEIRHQELMTAALAKGYLIAFWGQKYTVPPTPRGGTWSVDVYNTSGIILYNGA
jgi:hypothetical protein